MNRFVFIVQVLTCLKIAELHSWEWDVSPNISHRKDGTARAEVALRRTYRWTVLYSQWKKKVRAFSMLPQRWNGDSATFLVKRSMFSALLLVLKRVYKSALIVFHCNSVLGLFWFFFLFFQLVLEKVYRITWFYFLSQAFLPSYCSWQKGVIIQTSSCFQWRKIIRVP